MAFDNWLTPSDILDRVRCLFDGTIDFDPASNFVAQQYVKAITYCVDRSDPDKDMLFHHNEMAYQYERKELLIDGLSQNWTGNVFCNPPYSAGNIDTFVRKGISEWNKGVLSTMSGGYYHLDTMMPMRKRTGVQQMIFLVNTSSDTKWYHDLLTHCDTALLWRGRIKFWKIENGQAYEKWEGQVSKAKGLGKVGNSPRYLSTMFYFGQQSDRFMDLFADKGTFVKWIPKQQRVN